MDPFSVVGAASSIVALVEFTATVIRETRMIYRSSAKLSEDSATLEFIAQHMQGLSGKIVIAGDYPDDLKSIANQILQESAQLREALGRISRKVGENKKWNSLAIALREIWSQDMINGLMARLSRLQLQLSTHMQVTMRADIAKISTAIDELHAMTARMEFDQVGRLPALRLDFRRSIERLSRGDLSSGTPSADNLLETLPGLDYAINRSASPTAMMEFATGFRMLVSQASRIRQDWEVLQTVYFEGMWARHHRVAEAHADTFAWIFQQDPQRRREPVNYVHWLRQGDGIFWIHGKPGSGKSTLMKYLVHHPETKRHLKDWAEGGKLVVVNYFFWNSGSHLQKSQEGLLRTLLFEILRQLPEQMEGLASAIFGRPYDPGLSQGSPWPWNIQWDAQTLMRAFEYLRGRELMVNFCFFIDGLDEYKDEIHEGHANLIQVLRDLTHSPRVKVCISSRSWAVFRDAFGNRPDMTIKLEDLTFNDIKRYVTDTLNTNAQFAALSRQDESYGLLVNEVINRAQGVFLWVFLVVRDLLKGCGYSDDVKTMRKRVGRFPHDLEAYFQRMFDAIEPVYRSRTTQTFYIAFSRNEPLPLVTYCLVDDIQRDPEFPMNQLHLDRDYIAKRIDRMSRRLEGRSQGLLEVVVPRMQSGKGGSKEYVSAFEPVVEFLHQTVRDFLLKRRETQDASIEDANTRAKASFLLCQATFLIVRDLHHTDSLVYLRQLFYFARQAAEFPSNEPKVYELLTEILSQSWRGSQHSPLDGGIHDNIIYGICLASEYGLARFVKQKVSRHILDTTRGSTRSVPSQQSSLGLVLAHALLGEDAYAMLSPDLVEYLVSVGASPSFPCWTDGQYLPLSSRFQRRIDNGELSQYEPAVQGILNILQGAVEASPLTAPIPPLPDSPTGDPSSPHPSVGGDIPDVPPPPEENSSVHSQSTQGMSSTRHSGDNPLSSEGNNTVDTSEPSRWQSESGPSMGKGETPTTSVSRDDLPPSKKYGKQETALARDAPKQRPKTEMKQGPRNSRRQHTPKKEDTSGPCCCCCM